MIEEMRKLQRQNEEELFRERDEALSLARAAEDRRQHQEEELSSAQQKERTLSSQKETELREALLISEKQISSYRGQLESAESTIQEWKELATRLRAEAEDNDVRSAEQAVHDRNRIAKLEGAVAKGAEVEQLLEEQVSGYKIEAQRAREQMLLVTRETTHLREELTATSNTLRATQEEKLKLIDRIEALEGEQRTATTVAVKRLTLENEDLRNRLQHLQQRYSASQQNQLQSKNSSPSNSSSAGGFARIQQLENENDVLHGRVATLDAERNAAWKELQQLLDDHKLLHRQYTELKQNQNQHLVGTPNINSTHQPHTTASSEIALLRQQQQGSRYGTPQRGGALGMGGMMVPSSSTTNASIQRSGSTALTTTGVVGTRGAALASHYSELLGGIKEMSNLLRRFSTFNNTETDSIVDSKTISQIKDWLNTASLRGEAVANTLFTDEERKKLL